MSDRQLTELLDRAVHHAPQMQLTGTDMLAAGKGRVRRRRAVGLGGTIGAAALVAAVWGGLAGGDGTLLGTTQITPAGTVWESGETVEGTLFAGFQTIDDDQVAHSYDARLGREVTDGPVTLTLSDGGETVEQIPVQSEVPGLEIFAGERMTVAVWTEPEGVVTSVPLVGPVDPGGPATVQRTQVAGEELAYAVWAGDVVPLPEVVRDVYLVGQEDVAAVSGAPVEVAVLRAGDERAVAWADASRGIWGYAVDGQDSPFVEQLGHRPADPAAYVYAEGRGSGTVAVLPEGAVVDTAALADRTGLESAVLAGRPVVLAVDEGEVVPEVPFSLDSTSYVLETYFDDLLTLDTVGGGQLSVVPDEDGGLTLQERTGAVPVELTLEELTEGLLVRPVHGKRVVVASGWDPGPAVLTGTRVELTGSTGAGWVVPDDAAQVSMPDGTLVTLMAVDAADGTEVTAVGRQADGEVERWTPPVLTAGVEWRQVDGVSVPHLDGQPLPGVDAGLSTVRHYARTDGAAAYLVLEGAGAAGGTFVPLVTDGGRLRAAPEIVEQVDSVEVGGAQETVLTLTGGLGTDGTSEVVAVAVHRVESEGAANTWQVLGDAATAHMVIDPGLVVSVGAEQQVWLLYPTGSVDPAELLAGRIGGEALELPGADGLRVAVHDQDEAPPRVDGVPPTRTDDIPQHDLVVSRWSEAQPGL